MLTVEVDRNQNISNLQLNVGEEVASELCIISSNIPDCSKTKVFINGQVCDFYSGFGRDVCLKLRTNDNVAVQQIIFARTGNYLIHRDSGSVMKMSNRSLDFEYNHHEIAIEKLPWINGYPTDWNGANVRLYRRV